MRGLQAARSLGRDANPSERFGVINVPKKSNFERKRVMYFCGGGVRGAKAPAVRIFFEELKASIVCKSKIYS